MSLKSILIFLSCYLLQTLWGFTRPVLKAYLLWLLFNLNELVRFLLEL